MGIFSKLKFWKKDDLGLGKDFGADLGLPPLDSGRGAPTGLGQGGMPPMGGSDLGQPGAGMPHDPGLGQGFGPTVPSQAPPGQPVPMQQPFGAPVQPPQPSGKESYNKDLEVVSAKLDSIRYTLESINQRLSNLEHIANLDREQSKKRW